MSPWAARLEIHCPPAPRRDADESDGRDDSSGRGLGNMHEVKRVGGAIRCKTRLTKRILVQQPAE